MVVVQSIFGVGTGESSESVMSAWLIDLAEGIIGKRTPSSFVDFHLPELVMD